MTTSTETPIRPRAADALWIGACSGLAAGYLEAFVRFLLLPWAPPYRIRLGAYLWWMPPAANLLVFLAFALVAAAVAAWRPRLLTVPRLVTAFAVLAFINITGNFTPSLHVLAGAMLAAGLGTIIGRLADGRDAEWVRWSRVLTLALGIVMVGTAVGIEVSRARHERRAAAAAPPEGAPNIMLLVLDNVRSMSTSAYGYYRPTTPVLESLATRGVRFEHAYSTSSWSLPSHASLMTGRWAHEMTASWRIPLDRTHPTLAEALGARGYVSAGFGGNGSYAQREAGIARGFSYYFDYPLSLRQLMLSSKLPNRFMMLWQDHVRPLPGAHSRIWHRQTSRQLNDRLLGWVDRHPGRPFFVFVNYFDAHVAYHADDDITFPEGPMPAHGSRPALTMPFLPESTTVEYDRGIATMDRELGRLFAELQRRGRLENTVIVVTSDHGEEFWEHGVFGHGNTLYAAALQVPLILAHPSLPAGRVVTTRVSNRDVAATLLDLAGVREHAVGGCTLRRYLGADSSRQDTLLFALQRGINTPPEFPVSRGDMRSVLAGRWHLIRNGDGALELFDLDLDPWEQRDLARDSAASGARDALAVLAQRTLERDTTVVRCRGS